MRQRCEPQVSTGHDAIGSMHNCHLPSAWLARGSLVYSGGAHHGPLKPAAASLSHSYSLARRLRALEEGLPSKTAVFTMTARAIGSKDPDAQLRNPDDFAIKFLGPREQAILPEYPWNLLDLGFESRHEGSGLGRLPIRRMALQTQDI